jgi:ATP/maltotriose-dependent transcriptional regulator MalT
MREISGKLFLSPNTVRTHTRSIYRKLSVGSRADAVARAETLGLLDGGESSG